MPTGYTAPIHDGENITFKQFALRCARAFGAAIHQRDDSLEMKIQERTVDSYYFNRVDTTAEDLARLRSRTDEEWQEAFEEEVRSIREYNEKIKDKGRALEARYRDMIAKAENWTPPTDAHVGLKEFMLEQLNSSLNFDIMKYEQPVPTDVDSYKNRKIEGALSAYNHALKSLEMQKKSVAESNKWIRALKESLEDED
jgi:hypothetical protein